MTEDRVRKPELPRDRPKRDPSTPWKGTAKAGSQGPLEVGEESVGSAYDVIDRYMKEGERIASKFGDAYSELDLSENINEMQGRWFELTGELMANWFDMLGAAGERSMPSGQNRATRSALPDVEYEVNSSRTIRVSARLSPGAQRYELAGKPAELAAKRAPKIAWEAKSEHESDRIKIRIRVKDKHPPGNYTANIVNSHSGEILGALSVDVL